MSEELKKKVNDIAHGKYKVSNDPLAYTMLRSHEEFKKEGGEDSMRQFCKYLFGSDAVFLAFQKT